VLPLEPRVKQEILVLNSAGERLNRLREVLMEKGLVVT
jgi:hypothetical protein